MHSILRSSTLLCAALACAPATGEPIVLRWDPGVRSVRLSDLSSEVPPVRLLRFEIVGGGSTLVTPNIRPDAWDAPGSCELTQVAGAEFGQTGWEPGLPIDPSQGDWLNAYFCFEPENNWPVILSATNDFTCSGPQCPRDLDLFGIDPGVYSAPLRFQDAEGDWHAAWVALRVTLSVYPECNLCTDNPPGDLVAGEFAYIGFSYESEPDTVIVNGGGLCEADLTFDTILDLADVQAFTQGFLTSSNAADLNGDGILDLADVQRFVGSFVTRCGI